MNFAEVEEKDAQSLKFELLEIGLMNKGVKCVKNEEGRVLIPLCDRPLTNVRFTLVEDNAWKLHGITFKITGNEQCEFPKLMIPQNARLVIETKKLVEENYEWSDELEDDVPKSWDKFGNVIIFDQNRYFKNYIWKMMVPKLWNVVCVTMNVTTVAMMGTIRNDDFRKPNIDVVWGNEHWADFKDNGIRYLWDITKIMFSSGNITERHRMGSIPCNGEVIVDLFCGIGYFTLPLLVHGKASLVHACDWNPDALTALRRNLIENKVVRRCVIHEGDCREVKLTDVADRVILGLLPTSQCGWEKACEVLKQSGGVLHIHENVTSGLKNRETHMCPTCKHLTTSSDINILSNDCRKLSLSNGKVLIGDKEIKYKNSETKLWSLHMLHTIENILKRLKSQVFWEVEILNLTHVKSYAPHIDHIVLDLKCKAI